jgi:hypothetical protein
LVGNDFLVDDFMVRKILVAIDGSEHADHALNYAVDLAENYSAELMLLTVFHPTYYTYSFGSEFVSPKMMQNVIDGEKTYHEKILKEARKKIRKKQSCIESFNKNVGGTTCRNDSSYSEKKEIRHHSHGKSRIGRH